MSKKLTRFQKAGALISMAVLVGAWGVAVGSSGLATAVSGTSSSIPEVPAMALEQPASVQRLTSSAINPQAGTAGALSTLSTNGIPSAALYAYHHAETLLADADPGCKLPWNLVAAIGRVESNHGRSGGGTLSADGVMTPTSTDTAKGPGSLLGPFRLTKKVWDGAAIDSDGDGSTNPWDIDDAATTAGIFLCSGEGDLSTDPGARAAVKRYNDTPSYVDLVMKVSSSYANGFYSQTPDGYSASTLLTSQAFDQTLSDKEREDASEDQEEADEEAEEQEERAKQQQAAAAAAAASGDSGGESGDSGSSGGDSGSSGGDSGSSGGGDKDLGDGLNNILDKVTGDKDDSEDDKEDLGDVVDGVLDLLKPKQ